MVGKPIREIVTWSQDVEPHVLRFIDITPDDPTDQPTLGWCRIDGDMWYCYSEPKLENGKSIHLRFIDKNTATSASGNSQLSEDGMKWLPPSEDSFTKRQGKPLRVPALAVHRLVNGRLAEQWEYSDNWLANIQAGVIDPDKMSFKRVPECR